MVWLWLVGSGIKIFSLYALGVLLIWMLFFEKLEDLLDPKQSSWRPCQPICWFLCGILRPFYTSGISDIIGLHSSSRRFPDSYPGGQAKPKDPRCYGDTFTRNPLDHCWVYSYPGPCFRGPIPLNTACSRLASLGWAPILERISRGRRGIELARYSFYANKACSWRPC